VCHVWQRHSDEHAPLPDKRLLTVDFVCDDIADTMEDPNAAAECTGQHKELPLPNRQAVNGSSLLLRAGEEN
jgi:hypothetical protein